MTDEQLMREALADIKRLITVAKRYFIEYTPTAGEDLTNGALIRKANTAIAKLNERLLRE